MCKVTTACPPTSNSWPLLFPWPDAVGRQEACGFSFMLLNLCSEKAFWTASPLPPIAYCLLPYIPFTLPSFSSHMTSLHLLENKLKENGHFILVILLLFPDSKKRYLAHTGQSSFFLEVLWWCKYITLWQAITDISKNWKMQNNLISKILFLRLNLHVYIEKDMWKDT